MNNINPNNEEEEDDDDDLFYFSLTPPPPTRPTETIILLHGLLSSHLEWAHVTPHLLDSSRSATSYHILLVDLPGHSASSFLTSPPYTIPRMADRVASIIRSHALNGKAHVVGLSMGGFVTFDLARRYPGLCHSAFVTGAAPFQGLFAFLARRPWLVYAFMFVTEKIPDGVFWWLLGRNGMRRMDELRVQMRRNRRWEVVRDVYGSVLSCLGWAEVKEIKEVRTLCVAAGKQDDVAATRQVGEVWKDEGITERLGSRAVVVRKAVHAWDLQFPELFARGIRAWVEDRELPWEFEEL